MTILDEKEKIKKLIESSEHIYIMAHKYLDLDAIGSAIGMYEFIKEYDKKTTIIITHDVAEAISMANRVIVLSNRPAKIKKIYNIKLTGATSPINNRSCKEFNNYYKKIWESIDHYV